MHSPNVEQEQSTLAQVQDECPHNASLSGERAEHNAWKIGRRRCRRWKEGHCKLTGAQNMLRAWDVRGSCWSCFCLVFKMVKRFVLCKA